MKTSAAPACDPESSFAAPWYAATESAEADLYAVANHDFSRLSPPLLVACRNQEQLEQFIFREGLMCSEVIRFLPHRWNPRIPYPPNKILLLLPDWQGHQATAELVERWVNAERYTVQLNCPHPILAKTVNLGFVLIASAVIWLIIVLQVSVWLLDR